LLQSGMRWCRDLSTANVRVAHGGSRAASPLQVLRVDRGSPMWWQRL
jgi:hypothetical protein